MRGVKKWKKIIRHIVYWIPQQNESNDTKCFHKPTAHNLPNLYVEGEKKIGG